MDRIIDADLHEMFTRRCGAIAAHRRRAWDRLLADAAI